MSAAPSGPGGVPTAMKYASASSKGGDDLRIEAQPPGALVALDEVGQSRLVDGDDAVAQLPHALGIDVDAEDVVPELGETRPRDEAHVADAERHELHDG